MGFKYEVTARSLKNTPKETKKKKKKLCFKLVPYFMETRLI